MSYTGDDLCDECGEYVSDCKCEFTGCPSRSPCLECGGDGLLYRANDPRSDAYDEDGGICPSCGGSGFFAGGG